MRMSCLSYITGQRTKSPAKQNTIRQAPHASAQPTVISEARLPQSCQVERSLTKPQIHLVMLRTNEKAMPRTQTRCKASKNERLDQCTIIQTCACSPTRYNPITACLEYGMQTIRRGMQWKTNRLLARQYLSRLTLLPNGLATI